MQERYLFKSERLGFRNWKSSDLSGMAKINADSEVMKFFPQTQNSSDTQDFIERMQKQFTEYGYCYFAVELLADSTFIGFIGIAYQTYKADFTPCTDIGWRLSQEYWGKGYATEGAKRCLEYAFQDLALDKVLSIAPKNNENSEAVMTKIGMSKVKEFDHPLLLDDSRLKVCVLYEIECL